MMVEDQTKPKSFKTKLVYQNLKVAKVDGSKGVYQSITYAHIENWNLDSKAIATTHHSEISNNYVSKRTTTRSVTATTTNSKARI